MRGVKSFLTGFCAQKVADGVAKYKSHLVIMLSFLQNLGFALLSSTLLLANPFLFLGK
jgi:hypothetical protein